MPCLRVVISVSVTLFWVLLPTSVCPAQTPLINEGGVVNAADYTPQVAPGMIVSIFGSELAPGVEVATVIPLPTVLLGVRVEVVDATGVRTAPLFFVSPGQINAQLPFGLTGSPVLVRVRSGDDVSNEVEVAIVAAAPRLFTKTLDGRGEAILTHADYSVVASNNPARAGEWVVLYLTGLGAVNPPINAGQPGGGGSYGGDLNWAVSKVTVLVDGQEANLYFYGLTPNFVGLYQVNFQIPETAMPGPAEIIVRAGSEESQEEIIFDCALDYTPLASQTIGPAGGTLSASGFSLEVPAGTLAGGRELTVYGVTGSTYYSGSGEGVVFAVGGIPREIDGPLTVTFDVSGELPAGTTYIVQVEGNGLGGQVFVEATVAGNQVVATFEPADAGEEIPAGSSAVRLTSSSDRGMEGELQLRMFELLAGYRHALTPNEWFELIYPDGVEFFLQKEVRGGNSTVKAAILKALDDAREELTTAIAYDWRDKVSWPVSIGTVIRENRKQILFPPGEPGDVSYAGTRGTYSIRLALGSAVGVSQQGYYVKKEALRHLVAHLMQVTIDPTYALMKWAPTPWLWLHEALATRFAGWEPQVVNDGGTFLFERGLEYPGWNEGGASAERERATRHGWGASMFAGQLENPTKNSLLAAIYNEWPPAALPVEALDQVAARLGGSIGAEWLEFCGHYAAGAFNYGGIKTSRRMQQYPVMVYPLGQGGEDSRTFSWMAPDLMAKVYRFRLMSEWEETGKLKISLPRGGEHATALVYAGGDLSVMPKKISGNTIGQISNPGPELTVLLVNHRAVKPYDAKTEVQLKLAVDKGSEELELLEYLRSSLTFASEYGGWGASCGGKICGNLGGMNVDWDERIPIQWSGNSFTIKGRLSDGGSTYDIDINATLSADGLTFESATFYKKETAATGTVQIDELEVTNIPFYRSYPGPLDDEYASYVFRVEGEASIRAAVKRLRSRVISSTGKVERDVTTSIFKGDNPYLKLVFWRK